MAVNYDTYLIARQKIIDSVSIIDYYMDYVDENINLERYNRDCCPLHDEDSPSFFYFHDSGTFHCFGCGKTGGVTELHYHIRKRMDDSYTKTRAVLDLAKMYKVNIPNIFQEAKLDDVKKFSSYKKLSFKPKDQLVKPRKKLETDIEKDILRYKDILSKEQFKELLDDIDEIFFKNADVNEEVKIINVKLKEFVKGEIEH